MRATRSAARTSKIRSRSCKMGSAAVAPSVKQQSSALVAPAKTTRCMFNSSRRGGNAMRHPLAPSAVPVTYNSAASASPAAVALRFDEVVVGSAQAAIAFIATCGHRTGCRRGDDRAARFLQMFAVLEFAFAGALLDLRKSERLLVQPIH